MNLCKQYEPYLAALADNQADAIPPQDRPDLEAHVRTCPACQAEIAQQKRMAQLLAGNVPPAVPADRWRQVWDAVDAQTTSRTRSRPLIFAGWNKWVALASSAAVAAMILLAVLLWPTAAPIDTPRSSQPVQVFAFATQQDSDIQAVETYTDDETSMVITSGQQDVVVVWMVQNPQKSNT